ncbi:hypothetical protein H0H92_008892 [Tricholoma furcatifolium]|nr:hypothetical protein H0H92_008892 [Tricholoma furcatifolium]
MVLLPITSATDLNSRVDLLRPKITQPETEDSWEIISNNLKLLTDLCQNAGACDFPTELIAILRSLSRPITNSLSTERTRLSSVALDLISAVATGIGRSFKPLLPIFLPTLLSLCGRTNKVVITRSKVCITAIIESTQLPAILSYFVQSIEDKSTTIRLTAAEGTLTCVNCFNPPDLEQDARASEIETIMRMAMKDSQGDIRAIGRKLFEAYKLLLPQRTESFTGRLSPTTKKHLGIKPSSNPASHEISNPKNKLSSSTSALSSSRGHPGGNPVIHSRSVSSSTLPPERRAPTTAARQKTEMLPPAFVPVRPSTRTVSVSRSTSTTESRPRVVSTTLPSRTASNDQQPPARPNSATSNREIMQRPVPVPAPAVAGPSGPRRVPLPDPAPKATGAVARAPVPAARPRIVSSASTTSQSDAKAIARVPATAAASAAPMREKLKAVPRTRDIRPPEPFRPSKSTDKPNPPRTGGITQPTLAQIARAKAVAESKSSAAADASKQQTRGRSTATTKTSVPEKAKFKPTSSASKKPSVQPAQIPLPHSPERPSAGGEKSTVQPTEVALPPSPVQSSVQDAEEESPMLSLTPSTPPLQDEQVEVAELAENEETVTPCTIASVVVDSEPDPVIEGSETDAQVVEDDGETTIKVYALHVSEDVDHPATPSALIPAEDIFDASLKTPISTLLSSIERGFLYSPSSPMSPAQSYLNRVDPMQMGFSMPMGDSAGQPLKASEGLKSFMFGVGFGREENVRPALGNVENLNIDK